MERFAKLASPLDAATVVVPERVPALGLVPMATVMEAEELVTVLPKVSWTATWTAGLMGDPAVALVGWTVKATLEAEAGVMLKVLEVAPVRGAEAALRV